MNEALEANNTSYEIVSESTQLVDGVNHYVHLMGDHDGHKYTLAIHESRSGVKLTITHSAPGHLSPEKLEEDRSKGRKERKGSDHGHGQNQVGHRH